MQPWFWGRKEKSIGIIFESFIGTENADHFIDPVIEWLYVFIADRPVIPKTIDTSSFKVFGTEAQRNSSPMVSAATKHPRSPPVPLCATGMCVRFAFKFPSAVAGIKISKRP